jgi:uncharacterized SAM-binding protein YcdF (DUF218 family)
LQSHPYRWLFALVVLSCAGYLFATAFQVMREGTLDEARPVDAIVVFGAAEYVGRPSPVYRARLDHAHELFERGLAPLIITTGGAGKDPKFSEGQVGRDYLSRLGVPDVNLIAETQADDTEQSAQRVAVILEANELKSVLLVSDAYHLYRAKRMMQKQDIDVYISPRPDSIPKTSWGRWSAALREAFSYTLYRLHLT